MLEQTAENMEAMQRVLVRDEDSRNQVNQAILTLNERLATLGDTMRHNQQLMIRIADTQSALGPLLQRLGENEQNEVNRSHLRNIELYMQRLVNESEQGRARSTAELRNDIRLLTRTVAALAEPQR